MEAIASQQDRSKAKIVIHHHLRIEIPCISSSTPFPEVNVGTSSSTYPPTTKSTTFPEVNVVSTSRGNYGKQGQGPRGNYPKNVKANHQKWNRHKPKKEKGKSPHPKGTKFVPYLSYAKAPSESESSCHKRQRQGY